MIQNSFSHTNTSIDNSYIKEEKDSIDLENFILQNKIGEGAFGKVYQVRNKISGQLLAAKISIDKIEDFSTETLVNLYREVNIISKLDHPSVLKFIGFSQNNFKKNLNQLLLLNMPKMELYRNA